MLHEEQLNTKLLLISLTCNTPRATFTGYTSGHLMWLFLLSPFVCLCTSLLILTFNSGYEHAVLLVMSWIVFSKPENTSKWSLARQPELRQTVNSLIEFGVLLGF